MDAMELFVKLGIDPSDFNKGLDEAKEKTSTFGEVFKANIVSDLVSKGFTALVNGAKAAASGITNLVKSSVEAYSDTEQLRGGVEKLYGTGGKSLQEYAASVGQSVDQAKGKYDELTKAQNMVMQNADNAFRTAGMSANEYMDTATQFSASLINSLGGDTVAAAKQTDVAMKAISDNFNTFGGDVEDITNAYQGFAKQNYTMLDNLKLGYSGSKEGMEQLIKDANEWGKANGEASDLSIDSFSDVVTAIEQIQEKQGIAGTTAREATTTIQGSLGMMKSAWQNLVAGFADPDADIGKLFQNLTETIVGSTDSAGNHINGFLDNVIPAFERAFEGIGTAVEQAGPVISEKLPTLISNLLPVIINAIGMLVSSIGSALPGVIQSLLSVIQSYLPQLVQAIPTAITNIISGINEYLPQIVQAGVDIINQLASGLAQGIPTLLQNALPLILQLSQTLRDNAGSIIDAGINLIIQLAQGLAQGLPTLIEYIPTIITNIAGIINDNMPKILTAGIQIILILIKGIINSIPTLVENIPQIIQAIVAVWQAFNWAQLGKDLINFIGNGIKSLAQNLPNALKNIATSAGKAFKNINWMAVGSSVIKFIGSGISGIAGTLGSAMKGAGNKAKEGFKNAVSGALDWGKDIINNIVEGIKSGIGKVKDAASNVAGAIKDFLHFSEPDVGPLSDFNSYMPDMMKGLAHGMLSNLHYVKDASNTVAGTIAGSFSGMSADSFGMNTVNGYAMNTGGFNGNTGGFTQNVNIYSPEALSPSETARQTRNATRRMVLALRGE